MWLYKQLLFSDSDYPDSRQILRNNYRCLLQRMESCFKFHLFFDQSLW